MFVALFVGYVIGARTGSKELDQLVDSLRALRETDEFAAVLSAARAHLAHTLPRPGRHGRRRSDRTGRVQRPGRPGQAPGRQALIALTAPVIRRGR